MFHVSIITGNGCTERRNTLSIAMLHGPINITDKILCSPAHSLPSVQYSGHAQK